MYPLLRWRLLSSLLLIVVAAAVYADDLLNWLGYPVADAMLVRALPAILLGAFSIIFAPTGYWAPWRFVWRLIPGLNNWFPDLNGVWVGTTNSNWPTIKTLVERAQSQKRVSEQELYDTPDQSDAMAVQITCNLFSLKIQAALTSTKGKSHSITAKPWRHQHTQLVHLSYVYRQETPNVAATDEESHLGAADLALEGEDFSILKGTYWTRRSWRTGRNTAGTLDLKRLQTQKDKGKDLAIYADEHKAILDQSKS